MLGVTYIAILAVALPQWTSVSAEEVDRHHPKKQSRSEEVHTHSRENGTNAHDKHLGRKHESHRSGRKAGVLAQEISLLQAVPPITANVLDIGTPKGAASGNQSFAANAITSTSTDPEGVVTGSVVIPPATDANGSATAVTGGTGPVVVSPATGGVAANAQAVNAAPVASTPNALQPAQQVQATPTAEDNGSSNNFVCSYLWFLYDGCNKTNQQDTVSVPQNNTVAVAKEDEQPIPPVISTSCTIYGTTVLSLNDFKDAEENGWILISDSNTPKITHNKQVNLDKPAKLPLKATLCNAATYEATIKLGVDSIGGFIIRGSEQDFVVFEMNTLAKTATLKSVNGAYQDIITEVSCDQINSQFVQKVQINDTGYKGQIEIFVDGRKLITATRMPYKSNGFFGLYISQGNATFGDLSVVPING
ncbi:transmembrane protein, putative [Babesia ovis]|uniref:Transmembrane protein, putative n=1 Tax=Babesia ovis TaxID=5869 RepID=A0A9W5WUU0_BABOV|nr:transmembrane protein, putative [Babesia ovis]